MFFTRTFPKISYDLKGDGNYILAEDIVTRIIVRKGISERHTLFSKYDVKDYESPESIAHEIYGKAGYHWVILMTNKMFNRFYEWPLTEAELVRWVDDKYDDPYAIHHYEIPQKSGNQTVKIQVKSTEPFATAINNMEHERAVNDGKKAIKLLNRDYLHQFVDEYEKLRKNPFQ